jgi:putative endonuclease
MFTVYILLCADNTYYVGCTNNLKRRLDEHNHSDFGARHTKLNRPVILKYSENFPTLIKARRRERELKGWRREKKERLFS